MDNQVMVHSYPFCWRSETPLIYKAVPSWFVAVEKIKDKLLKNNMEVSEEIKDDNGGLSFTLW